MQTNITKQQARAYWSYWFTALWSLKLVDWADVGSVVRRETRKVLSVWQPVSLKLCSREELFCATGRVNIASAWKSLSGHWRLFSHHRIFDPPSRFAQIHQHFSKSPHLSRGKSVEIGTSWFTAAVEAGIFLKEQSQTIRKKVSVDHSNHFILKTFKLGNVFLASILALHLRSICIVFSTRRGLCGACQ